ncbi:MAG: caspase family protein [Saprospiraceae bacterium]
MNDRTRISPRPLFHLLFLLLGGLPILLPGQCLQGDCKTGPGTLVYADGDRYRGEFRDGLAEGEGMLFRTDGSRYVGQFREGEPQGKGILVSTTGDRQSGIWDRGNLVAELPELIAGRDVLTARGGTEPKTGCVSGDCDNGRGVYVMSDGAVYAGQFSAGEISGEGVCYYPDGSKYRGEWQHRLPHGRGTKTLLDGRDHTGQWRYGIYQLAAGDGRRTVLPGDSPARELNTAVAPQTGCLEGNCHDGLGFFTYPDGSSYRGHFRSGLPAGVGVFRYANGDYYQGNFAAGLQHGSGTLVHADQSKAALSGRWEKGEFYPQGRESGCLSRDCTDGNGTYVYPSGDRYVGGFRNGQMDGRGTITYKDGSSYEGQFLAGKFHGLGVYRTPDGRLYDGEWADNNFVSPRSVQPAYTPPPAAATRAGGKVYALIVGVSTYSHMPVLRFPDDDAYRIYGFLKSPEGGAVPDERLKILIDEDATRANILGELRSLFRRAGPQDLVFIYFSGHGQPGAFLPIDYNGTDNKLYHRELRELLDASPARYKLLLADACHSGSLLSARDGSEPTDILQRYYTELSKAAAGTALLMSSKSNETSLESSGLRQGVFSHFLIRGLKGEADRDGDRVVTMRELYQYVRERTSEYTGGLQSPLLQGDFDPMMPISVVR